ncbi:MAG: hypothetical protein JO257_03790 [Deltaproteobacteria bacterium]|nr:hypothetical protein [Deltaproteobacteria bacterium]
MRFLLVLCLVACGGADVRVHYPVLPDQPTGTLVLQLTQTADDVTVSINGNLVVDRVKTDHIIIDGVPVGTQTVIMAANGVDKQFQIWVDGDHWTTVPLGVPDPGYGFVKTLAGSLLTIIVYSLLHH